MCGGGYEKSTNILISTIVVSELGPPVHQRLHSLRVLELSGLWDPDRVDQRVLRHVDVELDQADPLVLLLGTVTLRPPLRSLRNRGS